MHAEVGQEAQLDGSVVGPVGVAFGYGDAVVEVQNKLHGQEAEEEADGILGSAGPLDGRRGVFALRDVVVEGDDGAGEIEGGVDGVG